MLYLLQWLLLSSHRYEVGAEPSQGHLWSVGCARREAAARSCTFVQTQGLLSCLASESKRTPQGRAEGSPCLPCVELPEGLTQ